MSEPQRAVAGNTFRAYTPDGKSIGVTVKPGCDDKNGGHWYCMTHDEHFRHQLQKDIHIGGKKKCKLVWWCHTHGAEQP